MGQRSAVTLPALRRNRSESRQALAVDEALAERFEAADSLDNIQYSETDDIGEPMSAILGISVEKLVGHMTSPKGLDPRLIDIVLLTYPAFMSAEQLLDLFVARFYTPCEALERAARAHQALDFGSRGGAAVSSPSGGGAFPGVRHRDATPTSSPQQRLSRRASKRQLKTRAPAAAAALDMSPANAAESSGAFPGIRHRTVSTPPPLATSASVIGTPPPKTKKKRRLGLVRSSSSSSSAASSSSPQLRSPSSAALHETEAFPGIALRGDSPDASPSRELRTSSSAASLHASSSGDDVSTAKHSAGADQLLRIRIRCINALKSWVTRYNTDFVGNEELIMRLNRFVNGNVMEASKVDGQQLLASLAPSLRRAITRCIECAEFLSIAAQAGKVDLLPSPRDDDGDDDGDDESASASCSPRQRSSTSTSSQSLSGSAPTTPRGDSGRRGSDAESGAAAPVAADSEDESVDDAYPEPLLPKVPGDIKSIRNVHPLEFARQLTLLDSASLCNMSLRELLGLAWVKHPERASHVVELIDRFNLVCQCVSSEVLGAGENVRHRAITVSHFVLIAHKLLKLNNFTSMMAVVSGLQSAAIIRLKRTWELLPPSVWEMWSQLSELVDPTDNFRRLRSATAKANMPVVPYIGCYLHDLTFIDEGNDDTVTTSSGTRLINFFKVRILARSILQLAEYQHNRYKLKPLPSIHAYLSALVPLYPDEKSLYDRSLELEPRSQAPPQQQ
jgi:RasGEF domain/RasGEF N-terminal motif